jgi:gliding motility-associated lipoprotein GldH
MNFHIKILFILFFLTACIKSGDKDLFYEFPEKQWNRFDNVLLEFEVSNPGIYYDMWVEVHYEGTPVVKQLPMAVIMSAPGGEIRKRHLELNFNDDTPGNVTKKTAMILRKDFAFSEKGSCTFEIENRSQKIEIGGLHKIGIIIKRSH